MKTGETNRVLRALDGGGLSRALTFWRAACVILSESRRRCPSRVPWAADRLPVNGAARTGRLSPAHGTEAKGIGRIHQGLAWVAAALVTTATSLAATSPTTAPADHAHGHGAGRASGGVVSMDVYADGGCVHLLTASREAGRAPALRYQRSDDGGETWAAPVAVGEGQPPAEPAHRGMDVQVAATGDRVVAVWTTEGAEDRFGRGPIATAVSADGGRTWAAGPNPADDGRATGHAFADVTAGPDGAFHVVWIDSRSPDGSKGLRYARSTDGGRTWSANRTLVPVTCECCWNTIATAAGGQVAVLYRQHRPRDMAIVCSADGGRTWGEPATVGNFGWAIDVCPHVGGGLAFAPSGDGRRLNAIVWTARGGDAIGAFAFSSADGGRTWADPHRLGGARSWHPDLASGPAGAVVAAWDANTDDGPAIFVAKSVDDGKNWSAPQRLSEPGASATHPRVLRTPSGYRAFWTEQREGQGSAWASRRVDAER